MRLTLKGWPGSSGNRPFMFKTLLLSLMWVPSLWAAPVALFDGKSLSGWVAQAGEEQWWKAEGGMIVGGSLTETVPRNVFLASTKSYANFDLTYKIRLVKGEGFMNSGMQIRSSRVPFDSEMAGYQVDAGPGYWGDFYDESRRNVALAKSAKPVGKDWEWNEFRVLCEGPRIRTWMDGVPVIDYTEEKADIPREGLLGIQVHGGGKLLVQVKDISLTELPVKKDGARTPEEQRIGFKLPEGFTAELVASEEQGVGKPITVAWDRHGKMWSMTALEYPVDANENVAIANELYQSGGRDKAVVFDEPNGPGPQTPRVFAEKLALPLGILPTDQGVYLQYGPQIRRYIDDDGDGKADRFEVVLEGFGFQDSHLFPHQFTPAPGGWIYLAQGAFNYSKVRRPGGLKFADGSTEVEFNNCKLARFRPDGSEFQPLTGGPNNIWGLAIARDGETFIQEANDLGYPVAEFAPGTHYPTGFGPKLRDDAPILPQSTPGQPMGGTGLSGLALADDADSPFAAGHGDAAVFYVANPITSRIQIVTMTHDAAGHPVFKKGEDFLTSDDPWFRPVSIHFGPDGCLYVVDWYNKIISHNEVPRNHPDRDKTHGRIWRIRHTGQQAPPRVDLAKLGDAKLLDLLGGKNAFLSNQAWQEIAERKVPALVGPLAKIISDSREALPRRMAALWALEGAGGVKPDLLVALAGEAEFQHEAVRIAGEASLSEAKFLAVISALGGSPNFRVRAAIANAVRYHRDPTPAIVACAARLGLAPLGGDSREAYDRDFERYLARWAMSVHPAATRKMLENNQLPAEARALAVRSLPPAEGAVELVKLMPELTRPMTVDELGLLASQREQKEVSGAFADLLKNPERRESLLRSLLQLDSATITASGLQKPIAEACRGMLAQNRPPERAQLALKLADKFALTDLNGEIAQFLPDVSPAMLAATLSALRQTGTVDSAIFLAYLDHLDDAVRRQALIGFAHCDDVQNLMPTLEKRWPAMPGLLRSLMVDALTSSHRGPQAFAKALAAGGFRGFDQTAVEKLVNALGVDHPAVVAMLEANKGLMKPVLKFGGKGPGRIATRTTLKGPFTVETWVKLPAPIGNDDGLMGHQGGPDFNFAGGKLRVYGGDSVGDVIISDRVTQPEIWTHCAITRDAQNLIHIYLDGELDPAKSREFAADLVDFNVAESHRGQGTAGAFEEFRVWNVSRSGEEIRRDFRTSMDGEAPAGLVLRLSGNHTGTAMEGSARIGMTMDFPDLVTPAEAAALAARFDRFRALAEKPGDAANGRTLFQATCMICHQVGNEGTAIGPTLNGAGAMGTEALLRNILTPNAQLESGYYRHDVKMSSGNVVSGFLASESDAVVTLRIIGGGELAIPRKDIVSHDISRRTLMPEGLLDGFSEAQVSDLFSYLKTLH